MEKGLIVLVGIGKSFGSAIARNFLQEGYGMVLVSKTESTLQTHCAQLCSEFPHSFVTYQVIDLTLQEDVEKGFRQIQELGPHIECVIYNAVARKQLQPEDVTSKDIQQLLKTSFYGAIHCTRAILPVFREQHFGALIYTGGNYTDLHPQACTMSIMKAALRNYVCCLSNQQKELQHTEDEKASSPTNHIFIGLINIQKAVRPENEKLTPTYVAKQYFKMFQERNETEYHLS